jgi:outer membrane protein assembly factor BamB
MEFWLQIFRHFHAALQGSGSVFAFNLHGTQAALFISLSIGHWLTLLQVSDSANTPMSFSGLRFSNDGKWMLGTLEGKVYVMDAFNGTLVRT